MSHVEDLIDFDQARRKARWALPGPLRSLGEAIRNTRPGGETYIGLRTIEVKRIVGSESRRREFNRGFLPRRDFLMPRWSRINEAFRHDVALPPIQVFELNGWYYVRDGNHRVSVARFHGVEFIDAEVVRITAA